MAEEKTYVFGESANNGILGLLGPMLSQRGVDPNVLLAMLSKQVIARLHHKLHHAAAMFVQLLNVRDMKAS